ncbi:MAG TPA: CxxxxCH/CxxCH domain-containing protein [Candidatus Methanoperedens sp.]|nr:CxxxxCH/CxxCH domain-containing protein [Candidatus Methanoperedens sp.]
MRRDDREHEGGRRRPCARGAPAWRSVLLALAWLLAGAVRPAAAFHFVQEGLGCYACHTLDEAEGDPNTSFINRTSRTMIEMKSANGGVTPEQFACTYCHNIGSRPRMRAVLSHFVGKASMHPVGKNFVTGADTNREYLSAWNTAFENELDCIDCHDVEAQGDGRDDTATPQDESSDGDPATSLRSTKFGNKYPEHGRPAFAANPYLLRSVTALDQYDPLCRVCHGNTAPLVKGSNPADNNLRLDPATAHADGVAVGAGGSGPIVEDDGTPLKPTAAGGNDQCRSCHDTHYSGKQVLFNDGHEHVSGAPAWETAIDAGTDCTSVCHYPGDAAGYVGEGPGENTFTRHGHGRPTSSTGATLNFGCTNCHTVDARHDSPHADARAPRMLAATPDPTASSYGTSRLSICGPCHAAKSAHNPGGASAGCLDCHDEHAEDVGAASNAYMVPRQLPNRRDGATEPTVFEHAAGSDWDFYISDDTAPHVAGAGVCDNGVCHEGVVSGDGTPVTPLSTLMTNGHHSGLDQLPLSNCQGCHQHNSTSPGGSFGATATTCTDCHGQPPTSLATSATGYIDLPLSYNEARTPHALHARANPNGYGIDCRACHYQGTSALTHRSTPSTYRSLWFDPAWNPAAAAFNPADPVPQTTPDYAWDAGANGYRCSQIYCHSDGSSTDAVGTAVWMSGDFPGNPDYSTTNLACDACHGDGDGNGAGRSHPNDAGGNHARHVGLGAGCQNCHFTTTADGTTILIGNGRHVDRQKDVAAGGSFASQGVSFGWDGGSKNCSAVSCHSTAPDPSTW